MIRRRRHHGFTLLELVLVMVIICITLAMAAPSLRGWSRTLVLRDTTQEVLDMIRFARTQSAAKSQVYRLNIDPASGNYYLSAREAEVFVPVTSSLGCEKRLPQGYRMELTKQTPENNGTIDFFPNGRSEPSKLAIISPDGDEIDIASDTPAEPFRIINPGNMAQ